MRENLTVKLVEKFIKENFSEELLVAPVNSMTPFAVELADGTQEYIFIVKAESWLYEPLGGKSIEDTVPMSVKAYTEDDTLIWGYDVDPDINLECVIPANSITKFLGTMFRQRMLTVVVVDHITSNIVWLTNDFPFWKVREGFMPLFEEFGVI